jgi:hypothetical protein
LPDSSLLVARLENLLSRLKSGTHQAPPVRRVHTSKGDGKEARPIGIPTLEDKVLQRAVAPVHIREAQGRAQARSPPHANSPEQHERQVVA